MIRWISRRRAVRQWRVRADRLYERLCVRGTFADIDKSLFSILLRQLAARDIIEQMSEGDLILGLKGEHIRKSRGFYAVFQAPNEYAVLFDAQRLGTVINAPQVDDHLLLAGRRWQVSQVDQEGLKIYVQPARGLGLWRRSKIYGVIGPKIREKMREILAGSGSFRYLNPEAARLFEDARRSANSANVLRSTLVPLGPAQCALMTWTGTKIQSTLRAMLAVGDQQPEDVGIALCFKFGTDRVRQLAREAASHKQSPIDVARRMEISLRRKYDWLLGDELMAEETAREWIDVPGATALLNMV